MSLSVLYIIKIYFSTDGKIRVFFNTDIFLYCKKRKETQKRKETRRTSETKIIILERGCKKKEYFKCKKKV